MSKAPKQQLLGFSDGEADRAEEVSEPAPESSGRAAGVPFKSAASRLAGQLVYVVDAHSLIYQVFHALPEMTGPSGQPVGAILGFIRDMVYLLDQKKPNYLFCAFDHPRGKTFRHARYEAYKAQRESMPDDLRPQIVGIHRMLGALGIPCLVLENYEADDIMATIAQECQAEAARCLLVTGDKDCRQLLTEQTQIYNIRKDEVFTAEALQADWGIRPEQVVDFQALVGDSVDNVPGVPLIGPKLARELLQKYETLDAVLAHAHEVSGKKRSQNLVEFREQALLSRELVALDRQVPIEIDWSAGRVGGIDREALEELCREFGFRHLPEQIGGLTVQQAPATWETRYRTITEEAEVAALTEQLTKEQRFAFALTTGSAQPRFATIVGIAFAWAAGEAAYLPLRSPRGEPQLDEHRTLTALKPIFENTDLAKIGHDLKYARVVLRSYEIELRGIAFDTMVAGYLLDAGERNHGLEDLAQRYFNHETIPRKDLVGSGRQQKRMEEVPLTLISQYGAETADVPFRLFEILAARLEEEELTNLFRGLELPLIEVLADLEDTGVRVDPGRLAGLRERFGERMEQLRDEVHQLAGAPFNIDSRLQLADVLFEQLGLPVVKRTKTGPSTDAEVLQQLAQQHALPARVLEYRQYAKLLSTYVEALPTLLHPVTGRIHTSFKQDVAATGRLSSTDPNLQNIPIRSQEGREIRSAFLPDPADWRFMTADYSQIELRVLAHYSGDAAMQMAFAANRDIHTQVASEINGVPLSEVTADMRRQAKAVNFGVIYGQSAFGLSKALGISKEDAATFIDAYFRRYAGVERFMTEVLENCRRKGYVSTILGRRRAVQGVRDPTRAGNSRQRNLPERIAINTVIQGSAADLIKQAMLQVAGRLQRESLQARMLLQIHDELVFEVPPAEVSAIIPLVRQEMTTVGQLDVPLQVDIKIGANWAECEPVS